MKDFHSPNNKDDLINTQSHKVKENEEITLRKTIRWFVLIIFFLLYVCLMMNVGIFSAGTSQIMKDLNIDYEIYGFLGSYNGSGKIIGTLLFMLLVNRVNRKYMTIISLVLNAISIVGFTLTNALTILYTLRALNGVFQVFDFLYFPIWIDQFGIQAKKTVMLTLIQLASPVGMVAGFSLNMILGSARWKVGLSIEAGGEIFFSIILLFIPQYYFSKTLYFKSHADGQERIQNKASRIVSVFYVPPVDNEQKNKDSSFWKNVNMISSNAVFIFSVLYKSQNQFLCCGLGYWLIAYIEKCLHVTSGFEKYYSYILIIVGGPMIGLLFGGFIGHYTGGYEKKKALVILCVLDLISCIIGMFAPFTDSILVYNIIMVIFFIFNSAVMPVLTGVILWSMPKHLKGLGNGIASLVNNVLGKFPAPLLYGVIQERFAKTIHPRIGMICLMAYNFTGVVHLLFCSIYRYKSTELKTGTDVFEVKADQDDGKDRPSLTQEHIAQVFATPIPMASVNEDEDNQFETNEDEEMN